MYRKTWRYHRDASILWGLFFLILGVAGYALQHPWAWVLALLLWLIRNPIRNAFIFAHPYRAISWLGETRLEFREVTFPSRDGLTLFGRFLPSRNSATIILIHPLGGANNDMLLHAEFLAKAGYGILMMDLRAHGSSDGDTSTYGLREANDVAGAVDYLSTRLDVNRKKIGILGISLGAQAAFRGALKTEDIRALVLEGLNPAVLSDHGGRPTSLIRWLNYPINWLYYQVYEFMIGGKDTGVLDVIADIAPRPILLIASSAKDIHFNRIFFSAARDPKELWELPNGEHGAAILQHREEYAKRVTGFFEKSLLRNTE
ncbi:MAG: alpha/beta fold hydrolase [Anaerolineales bacterium]